MINEQTILGAERLRDDLLEFRKTLRSRYKGKTAQVSSETLRETAARLAERWLVEISADPELGPAIGASVLADMSVHFQRILTFSEHATKRGRFDAELDAVLATYSLSVVVPLKQVRGRPSLGSTSKAVENDIIHSAFVAQSFAASDARVNDCVSQILRALGVKVVTGERPTAETISEKVKRGIEEQSLFVGIFTRRDKIARKTEWTTSAWVIDEKAYAFGRQKPLVLLKETGVGSIGGIQGDYQYIEFSRDQLETLAIKIAQLFKIANGGLAK